MIIKRYLTREILNSLLAVITVLMLAFLVQQTVRYLNYAAIGKIPTNVLLELVSFEVPYLLALLLPLGLYLGILLAYGRLYADNEMSILQLSGFGNERIIRLTVSIALIVTGVVLVLMLWVNPWVSTQRQQVMESDEATMHLLQTIIPGRFQVSPDGTHVIYVEKISRDHQRAENVFVAQAKKDPDSQDQESWMIVSANQGYQVKAPDSSDQFFVTLDGFRYEGVPGQNDYKITQFGKYSVRIPQVDARTTHQANETLSTLDLWNDYGNPKRAAELQWRFSMAIATFLLAMLAVPLSNVRPRKGRYLILLPAIIIYIVYFNLLFAARHWIEQGMVPILAGMWWVHALLILFIVLVMYAGKRRFMAR